MDEKILFLDFDGVLHAGHSSPRDWLNHLPLLASVLSGRNLGIVISSSWRFQHTYEQLCDLFPSSMRVQIQGTTGGAHVGRHARYQEILSWLSANEACDWRALDDSLFEFPKNCPYLIPCNAAIGIAEPQLVALNQWLNGTLVSRA